MTTKEPTTTFEPEKPIVPDDWDVLPFQKAATVVSDQGKRVKQSTYSAIGKIPVVDQGQDYIGGYIDDDAMAYDGELPVILFGDHTRSIKYIDKRFAVGAEGIKILKPAAGYNPKFFYYLLRSLQIPSRGYSRHFQFLKQFHLPIAPPDDQELIVAEIEKQFSRLDEAVANLKRVKANLKRYKAAVLKAAVEGKLTEEWRKAHPGVEPAIELLKRILAEQRRKWEEVELAKMTAKGKKPKDESWKKKYVEPSGQVVKDLSRLPANWVWSNVGQLAESMKNGIYKPEGYYIEDGIACLRMYNIEDGAIIWKDIKRMRLSKEEIIEYGLLHGDLLVNRVNSRELVGKTAPIPTGLEKCVFESKNIRVRLPSKNIYPEYLSYVIAVSGQAYFNRNAQQVVGMASISQPQLSALPVPLPPYEEQKKIVSEVEEKISIIKGSNTIVEANSTRAERLRQAILNKAFTGSLAPSDRSI